MAAFSYDNVTKDFYFHLDDHLNSIKYRSVDSFKQKNIMGNDHFLSEVEADLIIVIRVWVESNAEYRDICIPKKKYDRFFTWKTKKELPTTKLFIPKTDIESFIHFEGFFHLHRFQDLYPGDLTPFLYPDGSAVDTKRFFLEALYPLIADFVEVLVQIRVLSTDHALSVNKEKKKSFTRAVHRFAKTMAEKELEDRMVQEFVNDYGHEFVL